MSDENTAGVWQLPNKSSTSSSKQWVHHWSKYHYFENWESLCGRYSQDTEFYYQMNEDEKQILNDPKIACKKCYSLRFKN